MEKQLQRVAMIVMIVGLGLLYFVAEDYLPEMVTHLDVKQQEVRVQGVIERMTVKDTVQFIEIEGCKQERIKAIVFSGEDIYVKEGDYVEMRGEIEEYQGEKELIVSELKVK